MIIGRKCAHDTVVLGAFGCLDLNLDFDEDADNGVGVEGLISTENRPKTWSSQKQPY